MLNYILNKYRNSKALLNYFFLTYLDKIISFALPLSILFLVKDRNLYTFVEVAFSYATLVMIIIELGFSNYLFFGYKNAADKDKFLTNAQLYFKFLLSFYTILALLLGIAIHYYDTSLLSLFVLVSIRTLFTLFLSFYSNIFRLKDNPSGVYISSLTINISSIILLIIANSLSLKHHVIYFFLPSLLFISWISIKFLAVEMRLLDLKGFFEFLKDSLKFSWPIILNVLAMSYINNYAKIYAYGHLSTQETVQVSYIMRIGLIVQLTHASFSSFFSKSLFMDATHRLNFKIFKRYNLVLIFSAFLVGLIILVTNYLFSNEVQIPLSLSTFLFVLYIILWCYIGYLEIYFGIMNANKRVLYYSVFSSLVYTALLKFSGEIDLLKLSIFMVVTALLNLTLVIIGLNKLQVITLKKNLQ